MKPYILIALLLTACACQKTTITNGVPNLRQVGPGVWRGGQPTYAGFEYLKSIGVSNVVKLNTESEGSDIPALVLKMNLYAFPITTGQQIVGPVSNQIMRAVSRIGPGSFVHCEHGVNRTGTAIMVYRVMHDGWTKVDAQKEGDDYGWQTSFHALKEFWEDWKP